MIREGFSIFGGEGGMVVFGVFRVGNGEGAIGDCINSRVIR